MIQWSNNAKRSTVQGLPSEPAWSAPGRADSVGNLRSAGNGMKGLYRGPAEFDQDELEARVCKLPPDPSKTIYRPRARSLEDRRTNAEEFASCSFPATSICCIAARDSMHRSRSWQDVAPRMYLKPRQPHRSIDAASKYTNGNAFDTQAKSGNQAIFGGQIETL